MSPDLLERRLNLILTKMLLKFDLVLQKNLNKLDRPAHITTPPFLAAICLEEAHQQTQDGTDDKQETTEQEEEHHSPKQQLPAQQQEEEPNRNLDKTQTLTATPNNSPPLSESSEITTIIQTHPQEPSIDTNTAANSAHPDHQEPLNPQEAEQQTNNQTSSLNHIDGPTGTTNSTLPDKPRRAHKQPNQDRPESSKGPTLKQIRERQALPRQSRSRKKRRRKQMMKQHNLGDQRLSPDLQQNLINENSEMRPEFMSNTSVPVVDESGIPPGTVMGNMIRWGETLPAGCRPTFQPPPSPPPPLQHEQPQHFEPTYANFDQPYQTGPNGYNQYPLQYMGYHPHQGYWSYPGSEAFPNHFEHPHNPYNHFPPPNIDPATYINDYEEHPSI